MKLQGSSKLLFYPTRQQLHWLVITDIVPLRMAYGGGRGIHLLDSHILTIFWPELYYYKSLGNLEGGGAVIFFKGVDVPKNTAQGHKIL